MIKFLNGSRLSHSKYCYKFVNNISTSSTNYTKGPEESKSDPTESKSFAYNMFAGKIMPDLLFPYPQVLNKDQQSLLKQFIDPLYKFLEEKNDASKNDEASKIDDNVMQQLREMGAFGLQVPEKYDGLGLNNTQYSRLVEIVGIHDLALGITLGAHQSIGFKGILLSGTDEQKAKYLPDLAVGKKIAAFCLTEHSSGSDAASIQTTAIKSADGSHYVMNGNKIWISNGGIADIFTIFAKTPVYDKKTDTTKDKVTAFIVERAFGGLTTGPPEDKMGIKASNTAAIYLDDCKVPVSCVLGGEGNGFKVAMNILNNGRFGMAGALSGTMKMCISKAATFASERTQFGDKIKNFGIIQEKLTTMAMKHYITESMAYHVSGVMDQGYGDFQMEAAISKIYASEAAWMCADEAIQICGGQGFMKGEGLERVMRDLRIFRIFEGTNDILRLFVALTSMQNVGKKLRGITSDPTAMLAFVSSKAKKSVGYGSGGISINRDSLISKVHNDLNQSANLCCDSIEILAGHVQDLLMKHKKDVINQQIELQIIANIAIECYAMSAGISRATLTINNNIATRDYEKKLIELYCLKTHDLIKNTYSKQLSSASLSHSNSLIKDISVEICHNYGVIQSNPLGF